MPEVSAYEAKTHFSQLLARAERGERITITKHGRAVALLGPVAAGKTMTKAEAIAGLKAFRATHSLGPVSIRDLIDDGRKW